MSDEREQLLLQYFLSHRIVAETEIHSHFPRRQFEEQVRSINLKLQIMMLEIKRVTAEEDGTIYWGISNLKEDDLVLLASMYGKNEIELFKAIVLFFFNISHNY